MTREVYTINPFCSVLSAQNILESNKIGGLPVVEDKKVIGIITSFDVRRSHPNRLVFDAMTKNPITISENENIIYALKMLKDNNIERLPVVNQHNELIGIITKGVLLMEAGKRIDLLTGLQRSQTIVFNTAKILLENNDDIVCLFFDLNEFGIFNKKHGHIVGDEIIQKIGEILKTFIETDRLCRFGGDEFVAIIPSNLENGKKLARDIISYITSDNYLKDLDVSLSIGISGGRRNCVRYDEKEITKDINNLINLASLVSTKAKSLKLDFAVADELRIV
ncbi:MAG: hypothetical protein VR72_05025 [Clostridiaceae bacterium BRH_c20a]|nr:MAG: hypothetical protein VR72_05025 [Clostridiaceae bacterium BRH_c20a]